MSLTISSPAFSFLNFNNLPTQICDNDVAYPLPVYQDFSIKGQVQVISEPHRLITDKLYIGICGIDEVCVDDDCNCGELLLDEDIELTPVCSFYKWNTIFEDDIVPEDEAYNICNLNPIGDELFPDGDFEINPFSPITSNDLDFDINFDMAGEIPYGSYFTLYIADKIYFFKFTNRVSNFPDPLYDVEIIGNLYKIDIAMAFDPFTHIAALAVALRLKQAIEEIIDINHSTTTTVLLVVPYTITITGIPADSYVYDGIHNILANINTVGVDSGIYFKNGFYNAVTKQLNYKPFEIPEQATLKTTISLVIGSYYKIKFGYATIQDFGYTLNIRDSSTAIVYTNTITPLTTSFLGSSVTEHFLCPLDDAYTFEFIFTPTNLTDELALDNFSIVEVPRVHVTNSNSSTGYVPIPTGYYSQEELYAVIEDILDMPFICEFNSCCIIPKIEFTHTFPDDDSEYVYTLDQYWDIAQIDFPEIDMGGIIEIGKCFKYCILDEDKNVIACSNLFKRIQDDCFTTLVEYWNNENAFGFQYPNESITNLIRLPFFAYGADYPTTEKIYKDTSGNYKRLSTVIEKEYDVEVDKIPEWLHDMIIVALKHDRVLFTTDRIALVGEEISQQGNYTPDWKRTVDFKAKAKFKFRKKFNGSNSNCKSSNTCS